ncbi:MAG: 50S ribosomal protein L21 [Deltaproteobacteria bacterium]|nr:50S ribosomal protein L21 [Deltaproteobacteria bacterium]
MSSSLSNPYAIIKTGGKQYRVSAGQQVTVEKLPVNTGENVVFDEVLMVSDGTTVRLGQPALVGARVVGTVVEQTRDNKILVHKYRHRKNSRKTIGHRQWITRVRIQTIEA